MINKQNLWFLTLFSLILVLSVYYITMPNDLLLTNNSDYTEEKEKTETNKSEEIVVEESDVLVALRVNLNQERETQKDKLEGLLTDNKSTSEDKNSAYEELKELNLIIGQEQTLENKIKNKYSFNSFIKIDGNEITVVIDNDKHDTTLANNIMRLIQEEFKQKMYITVQFK